MVSFWSWKMTWKSILRVLPAENLVPCMAWLPGNVVRSVVSIHETDNNPICCKTGWSNVGSKTRDIIHKNLSWKPYITSICGKVAKVIGILSRSRRYVPSVTLKALYNSLFLPYINYSNFIWASTYASYLETLLLSTPKESHSNYHLFSSTNSF